MSAVPEPKPARRRKAQPVAAAAIEPRLSYVRGLSPVGFHRMAVWEWGERDASTVPVVCVHGLTRQGRDFDTLAHRLVREGRYVICPDVVGRGRSDWLRDSSHYNLVQYIADMNALLAWVGGDECDWVGTSLGGLIGMALAAYPGAPIRRLVLNDVGPSIPSSALRRIGARLDAPQPKFDTLAEAEAYLRVSMSTFGEMNDLQWRQLAQHSFRQRPEDGQWVACHDPTIAKAYRIFQFTGVDMWKVWDAMRCKTLVLHGAESDFLSPQVLRRMRQSGPAATAIEVPDCGHAPALVADEQVDWVAGFLANGA